MMSGLLVFVSWNIRKGNKAIVLVKPLWLNQAFPSLDKIFLKILVVKRRNTSQDMKDYVEILALRTIKKKTTVECMLLRD